MSGCSGRCWQRHHRRTSGMPHRRPSRPGHQFHRAVNPRRERRSEPITNAVHLTGFVVASFLLPVGAAGLAYLATPWRRWTISQHLGPASRQRFLRDIAGSVHQRCGDEQLPPHPCLRPSGGLRDIRNHVATGQCDSALGLLGYDRQQSPHYRRVRFPRHRTDRRRSGGLDSARGA